MSHSPSQQVNGGEAFAPMADPTNTLATSNPSGTRRGSPSAFVSPAPALVHAAPPVAAPPSLLLPSPPLPSPHPSLRQSHQPFPQPPSSLLPPPLPLAYISLSASGPTVFDWLQVLSGLAAPPAAADPAVELEDPEPVAVPECDASSSTT
ncbi:8c93496d-e0f5-4b28-913f-91ba39e3be37 [Thermothielavioides terrestris]|uniref:8c93496d-e0f5-4b28-913f-91ba39e3be37 n=1 Tax=Thermothielavioides terrestris TaxID=2587410 RepID=A0A3S4BJT9_9PEZI|nr:8c93496d-e0f5-4b28-913f-91ba39e3be37 [Thermothielavioides terrestris]